MAIVLTRHMDARYQGKVWLMQIGCFLGRLLQTDPRSHPSQLPLHLQRDIGWRDGSGWTGHAGQMRSSMRDIGPSWPPPA
ncbi:MAG: hypothetical protein WAS21_31585 [Geminicoccaceae bacterium]